MGSVRSILFNRAYTGCVIWGKQSLGKFHKVGKVQGCSVAVERPRSDMGKYHMNQDEDCVVVENAHPALISQETWDKVQALNRERRQGTGGSQPRLDYMLSGGITLCADCGHAYQGWTRTKGKRRKDRLPVLTGGYVCGGYHSKGKMFCDGKRISKEALEDLVLEKALDASSWMMEAPFSRTMEKRLRREIAGDSEADLAKRNELEKKLQSLDEKIRMLVQNVSLENLHLLDAELSKLRKERESLARSMARISALNESPDRSKADLVILVRKALASLRRLKELFNSERNKEFRNEFFRLFVRKILISAKGMTGTIYVRRPKLLTNLLAGAGYEEEKKERKRGMRKNVEFKLIGNVLVLV